MLTNSTVSGNRASNSAFGGGGIANENNNVHNVVGTLTLSNSTLSGNTASYGGGIQNEGHATLTNSTLAGNVASKAGGGIQSSGFGGTLPKTIMTNSTLAGNTSVTGGAIYMSGVAYSALTNTIVSNSSGSTNCHIDNIDSIDDRGGNIDDGAREHLNKSVDSCQ